MGIAELTNLLQRKYNKDRTQILFDIIRTEEKIKRQYIREKNTCDFNTSFYITATGIVSEKYEKQKYLEDKKNERVMRNNQYT